MHLIDILLLIPLVYGFYSGYRKGLVRQILSLVGIFVVILLSRKYGSFFNDFLVESHVVNPEVVPFVGHLLFFSLLLLGLRCVGNLLKTSIRGMGLGTIESLLGGILGLAKNFLILSVLLFIFVKINEIYPLTDKNTISSSVVIPFFQETSIPFFQHLLEL